MKTTSIMHGLLLPLLIACFSGCSVIGRSAGGASANGDIDESAKVPNAVALQAAEGDRLLVYMGKRVMLDIVFHALVEPEEEDILERVLDRAKEADSDCCIRPGDRVRLQQRGGKEETGVLLGASTTDLWYRFPDEKQLRKAPFRDLASVQSGKADFREGYLGKINAGQLPFVYYISATLEGDSIRIPLRNVDSIVLPQSSPAAAQVISTVETVHDVQVTLGLVGVFAILIVAFIAGGAGG